MAEENNLENEFDDNLAADDVGLPEVINDELDESPVDTSNNENPSILNRLKTLPSAILSSRRNMILAGVITLALVLTSFFLFRDGSDNQVTILKKKTVTINCNYITSIVATSAPASSIACKIEIKSLVLTPISFKTSTKLDNELSGFMK